MTSLPVGGLGSPSPTEVNDFHRYADTDASFNAIHHTLGENPEQAAPGNHEHKDHQLPLGKTYVDNLYTRNLGDLPRSYPIGISFAIGDAAWPTGVCAVQTIRTDDFSVVQIAYAIGSSSTQRRHSNHTLGNVWSAWSVIL